MSSLLLTWMCLVQTTAITQPTGAVRTSEPELYLLHNPGRFMPVVVPINYREGPTSAHLPFSAQELLEPLRAALVEQGVPLAADASDSRPPRTLELAISLQEEGRGYDYTLHLEPAHLPHDPEDVVYDAGFWPRAAGHSNREELLPALLRDVATLAAAFGQVYAGAKSVPAGAVLK